MKTILFKIIFVLLSISLIEACSNNLEEYEAQSTSSLQYSAVTKSSEYIDYKNNLKEVNEEINTYINNTSVEDKDQIAQLYMLYKTDPQKYQVLLETKIKKILNNDYNKFEDKITKLYNKEANLQKTKKFRALNTEDKSLLSSKILDDISITNDHLKSFNMTRSFGEGGGSSCVSDCARTRDRSINNANVAFGCTATASIIAICYGGAIPGLVAMLGAAYYRDYCVRQAHEDYSYCVSRC